MEREEGERGRFPSPSPISSHAIYRATHSPCEHEDEAEKIEEEYPVVMESDAVVDPGVVVVKPSHTGVAGGTVLGTQGAMNLGGGIREGGRRKVQKEREII